MYGSALRRKLNIILGNFTPSMTLKVDYFTLLNEINPFFTTPLVHPVPIFRISYDVIMIPYLKF